MQLNDAKLFRQQLPFGGVTERGLGREDSKFGIDDDLATQYLCLGGV